MQLCTTLFNVLIFELVMNNLLMSFLRYELFFNRPNESVQQGKLSKNILRRVYYYLAP